MPQNFLLEFVADIDNDGGGGGGGYDDTRPVTSLG
jgi:hypothetical protein